MQPDVLDPLGANDHSRLERRPTADAGDEAVGGREAIEAGGQLGADDHVLGSIGDRGEGPVDVEQEGRGLGVRGQLRYGGRPLRHTCGAGHGI